MAKVSIRDHILNLEHYRDQAQEKGYTPKETKKALDEYINKSGMTKQEAKQILGFVNQSKGANALRAAIGQGALLGFGDE